MNQPTSQFSVSKSLSYQLESPLITRSAVIIQASCRRLLARRYLAKLQKKVRYRKHIITEIVKSEESYSADLNLLIENCYKPLLSTPSATEDEHSSPILTKSERESLFSNLVDIHRFSVEFHTALQKQFDKYTNQMKFSPVMIEYANQFKVYYPFTANYDHSAKTLETLKEKNKDFGEFLYGLEYTPALRDMDLSSFMIKPVQRLTKYPLLLADLLKNTPEFHADYEDIKEALDLFRSLNQENNLHIEQYAKTMRMIELQEVYGSKIDRLIYTPERSLLAEESIRASKSRANAEAVMRLIIMSDMILVIDEHYDEYRQKLKNIANTLHLTEHSKKDAVSYLELSGDTIVKDIPDGKYISNIFSISAKNNVQTLSAEKPQDKERIMGKINDAVTSLKYKELESKLADIGINIQDIDQAQIERQLMLGVDGERKFNVNVIGTEDRTDGFKPHTYYITLISWGPDKLHKCFKKHSQYCQLSRAVHDAFPKKQLPKVEKKFDLLKKQRTRTIEKRKLTIEKFLHIALQDSETRESLIIQDFIKFPSGFFDDNSQDEEYQSLAMGRSMSRTKSYAPLTRLAEQDKSLLTRSTVSNSRSQSIMFPSLQLSKQKRSSCDPETPSSQATSRSNIPAMIKVASSLSNQESGSPSSFAKAATNNSFSSFPSPSKQLNFPSPGDNSSTSSSSDLLLQLSHSLSQSAMEKHCIAVDLVDNSSLEFDISNRTSARWLCQHIAQHIHLQSHDDYRLFLIEGKNRERALDGDEIVMDVIKVKERKQSGFITTLKNSMFEALCEAPKKLCFKKYYYLPKKQEQNDYLTDKVRLKLLVLQSLAEVKDMRYDFDYKNYLLTACLAAYDKNFAAIQQHGADGWYTSASKKDFLEFIPSLVLETKPEEFWDHAIEAYWTKVVEEVRSALQKNLSFIEMHQDSNEKHIQDTLEMYKQITEEDTLVKNLIINVMWSQKCYGVTLYEAKVYQPNKDLIDRHWPDKRFLFGIRYGEMLAFSMNKGTCYLTHQLSELKNIKCYPTALVLTLMDYEIRLDSKKSFEISQLIRTYQRVEQLLAQDAQEERNQIEESLQDKPQDAECQAKLQEHAENALFTGTTFSSPQVMARVSE